VQGGTAYLWGQGSDKNVALARVSVGSIEDASQYEFYVNGSWTSKKPALGNTAAKIENASAGGQGTYYYSQPWQSYVWIGQAGISVSADFYITTAPHQRALGSSQFIFIRGLMGIFLWGRTAYKPILVFLRRIRMRSTSPIPRRTRSEIMSHCIPRL
jgi:hypothetical protein